MKNGFVKIGAAAPKIRVADPAYNANELISLTKEANAMGVHILVFPELSITGATCGDLFYHETLIKGAASSLENYLKNTKDTNCLVFVGLPIAYGNKLYNCAAACSAGKLLGIIPKTSILSHPPHDEGRYFAPAPNAGITNIPLCGTSVPFGKDILLDCREMPNLTVAAEIGADAYAPISPSVAHTAAGATLVCNLSASGETVGTVNFRKQHLQALSKRLLTAYVLSEAGDGESTTDNVFGGHKIIYENGDLIAEQKPFNNEDDILVTEIDISSILFERRRSSLFQQGDQKNYQIIEFSLPVTETLLTRRVDPHPFIPADPDECAARCETILSIQTVGLKTRVERAFAKKIVLGISGGLDSTLALLVMVRAMDALKRPRKDIVAVTMPCFGTTKRTKNNATVLCEELGVDFRCVDIYDAVNIHFRDIGHDPEDRNVTYENSQARERTQILMDIANDCGGMVIGTGDLSELALGWATYNGDHMSMYGVNADIPKTLVRYLVAHCADAYEKEGKQKVADALRDVLNTPVSPELLPANENGEIAQKTEDLVGPYELHDFYLYHMLRYGTPPAKLYRLAKQALGGTYDDETLKKWLKIFVRRFFNQQFKRSCLPDGPKVGSVGLSPRGDWRMPSDASSALWLAEAESL
ncbi:MAG: NAD(+) synthase [Clostridia bacterium]|nr:NAD(+) synthase [Clostridia bacterium]